MRAAKPEAKTRVRVAETARQGQSARLEECLPSQSWVNADHLEERLFRKDLRIARNWGPKLDNNKKQDRLPPAPGRRSGAQRSMVSEVPSPFGLSEIRISSDSSRKGAPGTPPIACGSKKCNLR